MLAEKLGEADLKESIESKLDQLGFVEANLLNKLGRAFDELVVYLSIVVLGFRQLHRPLRLQISGAKVSKGSSKGGPQHVLK
jgi:hypothetical protein